MERRGQENEKEKGKGTNERGNEKGKRKRVTGKKRKKKRNDEKRKQEQGNEKEGTKGTDCSVSLAFIVIMSDTIKASSIITGNHW